MAHPYFPLKMGARWTYSVGQTYGESAVPELESIVEVVAVRSEGSRVLAEVVTRFAGPAPSESRQQWIVTRDGLIPSIGPLQAGAHEAPVRPSRGFAPSTTPSTPRGSPSAGEVRVGAPSGVYLPNVLDVQLPWSYSLDVDTPLHTLRVSGSSRLVGFEAITVPAGRFEAAHVHSTVRTQMEPKFALHRGAPEGREQGELATVPGADQVQEEDLYYVRGVGLVRARQSIASGYASDKVLVSFQR